MGKTLQICAVAVLIIIAVPIVVGFAQPNIFFARPKNFAPNFPTQVLTQCAESPPNLEFCPKNYAGSN